MLDYKKMIAARLENKVDHIKPLLPKPEYKIPPVNICKLAEELVNVVDEPKKEVVQEVQEVIKAPVQPVQPPVEPSIDVKEIAEVQDASKENDMDDGDGIPHVDTEQPLVISNIKKGDVIASGPIPYNLNSVTKNSDDLKSIEWGRERNLGFVIGRVWKPSPLFFSPDGHNLKLEDLVKGSSVILTGDRCVSAHPNVTTFGFEGSYRTIHSRFWAGFRRPVEYDTKFLDNPNVLKFMPFGSSRDKRLDGKYHMHSPSCCYFVRCADFKPNQFFFEDAFWYSAAEANTGLIATIKICYVLGFRNIILDGITVSDSINMFFNTLMNINKDIDLKIYSLNSNLNVPSISNEDAIRMCSI